MGTQNIEIEKVSRRLYLIHRFLVFVTMKTTSEKSNWILILLCKNLETMSLTLGPEWLSCLEMSLLSVYFDSN